MERNGSGSQGSCVVFVVDDDLAVRGSLKFSLEAEGFIVRAFPDGGEVLTADELPAHGCLVVDYGLPGGNGLALLDQLRKRGMQWPAILITTEPSHEIRARAGAADVAIVEKPLLTDALLMAIREAFARHPDDQSGGSSSDFR